jgi:hypothetical protein
VGPALRAQAREAGAPPPAPLPRLHAGGHLPRPVLEAVALERHALLPECGYLLERTRG